mmetsp:Transcript_8027/g.30076  ORF Transcript_8027/g.30076 Transcript_8027/m.30076 type:complete len:154 (-) Transcript_8027:204-665(-)
MSKAATLEINSAALKAASVATAIVFSKCVAVNLAQAVLKFQLGSRPPEDSDVAGLIGFGEQTKFGTSDSGSDALARVERIQANDNENVPFGLVLIWAGVLATKNPSLHAKLALGFAASRLVHTIAYSTKLSLLRSTSYMAGVGCMVAMLVGIL